MASSPIRYRKVVQELGKHANVQDALIASGFSEKTAKKQGKRVLAATLRNQAKDYLERKDEDTPNTKVLMREIVGMSSQEVFDALKRIALNEKDYGSALKVLIPLARQENVVLSLEESEQKAPSVLNVIVKKNEFIDGNVTNEPKEELGNGSS